MFVHIQHDRYHVPAIWLYEKMCVLFFFFFILICFWGDDVWGTIASEHLHHRLGSARPVARNAARPWCKET